MQNPYERGAIFGQLGQRRAPAPPSAPASSEPSATTPQTFGEPPVTTSLPSSSSTKRLLITATSKGGVGKSFFLVNLADWFNELAQKFTYFDSDYCNGTLTRFFPESHFVNPQEPQEAVREITEALQNVDVVGWDALGPMQQYLPDWLESSFLGENKSQDFRITLILMVEEDKDTVFQAGEIARSIGDQVDWIVVKNLKTCSTTEIYDKSKARQELLRLGALEITMERVPWTLLATIQKTSRTLSSLVQDESLPFLERQRLRTFQRRFFEQLESARPFLMPAVAAVPKKQHPEGRLPHASRPRVAPEEV